MAISEHKRVFPKGTVAINMDFANDIKESADLSPSVYEDESWTTGTDGKPIRMPKNFEGYSPQVILDWLQNRKPPQK